MEFDELERELDVNVHDQPPIGGELRFTIDVAPVSLQAKKDARDAFEKAVREVTREYKYLFTGDVGVDITLQIHQSDRYESDASPDLDNFLKPLLDSLSGPEGLLIDDCQVRTLSINWISWLRVDPQLHIEFSFIDSEFISKEGLLFVQMEGPLCMPVDTSLPLRLQRIMVMAIRFQFQHRRLMRWLGADYYTASAAIPQRRFHRTRVKSFDVKTLKEYKRSIRFLRFPLL